MSHNSKGYSRIAKMQKQIHLKVDSETKTIVDNMLQQLSLGLRENLSTQLSPLSSTIEQTTSLLKERIDDIKSTPNWVSEIEDFKDDIESELEKSSENVVNEVQKVEQSLDGFNNNLLETLNEIKSLREEQAISIGDLQDKTSRLVGVTQKIPQLDEAIQQIRVEILNAIENARKASFEQLSHREVKLDERVVGIQQSLDVLKSEIVSTKEENSLQQRAFSRQIQIQDQKLQKELEDLNKAAKNLLNKETFSCISEEQKRSSQAMFELVRDIQESNYQVKQTLKEQNEKIESIQQNQRRVESQLEQVITQKLDDTLNRVSVFEEGQTANQKRVLDKLLQLERNQEEKNSNLVQYFNQRLQEQEELNQKHLHQVQIEQQTSYLELFQAITTLTEQSSKIEENSLAVRNHNKLSWWKRIFKRGK